MSDILIKGMEIKDYPQSITINPDGSVIKDAFGLHRPMDEWKAIVLPKHGRCIDADRLKAKKMFNGNPMKHFTFEDIDRAPTVLEASYED